jgi:phosphate transport system substrate-binding protein
MSLLLALAFSAVLLTGCGGAKGAASQWINVVSREDGSGTRGAFVELFKLEEKSPGKRKDLTTKEAIIANKTDVMFVNVVNDVNAIGYISLGSLNDTVKALAIDGANATGENIKNGSYKIARPFNIATNGEPAGLTRDFIDFILSAEGQAVVEKNNYTAINDQAAPYKGDKPSGKITIAGSTAVTPIIEKLKEAYIKINQNATIEVQMTDSTAGMNGAIEGTCDIGMASRGLRDSEKQKLKGIEIAIDGIAVIVNNKNPVTGMTSANVRDIFTGKAASWSEIAR